MKKRKNSQRKKGLLRRIAVHAKPDIFYKVFRHIIIRQSPHSFAAYLLTAMMRRWRNRPLHKLTRSHEYITLFSIQIWNGREYEGQVQKICSKDETIGTLRSNGADDNENVKKKTIGLISKTAISHAHHTFLYISFPFLHDCDVKMPNFAFYGGRKQATTKFYFSFWAWLWSLEIQLQEGSPTIDKVIG